MKEQLSLAVKPRATKGKGACRRLRVENLVPGIFYDSKGTNIPVMVAELPLTKLREKTGSSHVFDLVIEGEDGTQTRPSLMWNVQRHPTKPRITHVDFYGVDLEKVIRVSVPVVVTGKAKGVVLGGKLEVFRDMIEVECLPLSIPDKVTIDVTALGTNENVVVSDLVLPEGVKAVYDDNYAVVGVVFEAEEEDKTKAEA
ncbi:lsu ribosomal protein l25p [hydrocarbon metagenome]|uniref:Lsu ribosomal protein l25p n=1 Tax=hydrocarbon metagenome TaxID=938273 RepID=A0A0W8G4E6_9ZZZZ